MDLDVWLKIIHILSATVLLGSAVATTFHVWLADHDGEPRAVAAATHSSVRAAYCLMLPAAIIQPASGWWLMSIMGFLMASSWLVAAYICYAIAIACWIAVVWLQAQARDLAGGAIAAQQSLPPACHQALHTSFVLACPAFAVIAIIVGLMVVKPELW